MVKNDKSYKKSFKNSDLGEKWAKNGLFFVKNRKKGLTNDEILVILYV